MTESSWVPPTEFPDLKQADIIAIDCETRDPNLMTHGPGGVRGDGYVVGVSVAVDGFKAYYPMRHEGGGNLPANNVIRYLQDQLGDNTPKVGANILYDLEWLHAEGVKIGGKKYDVQVAEPLLDEERFTYKLDALAESYLGEHKDDELLKVAARELGLKDDERTVKSNIWRFHSKYVGPYGEKDADLPLRILKLQLERLRQEELMTVFDLETRLVDLLLAMRIKGIPVDVKKGERIRAKLEKEQKAAVKQITKLIGTDDIDIWSAVDISAAAKKLDLNFPVTEKGNPSFEAAFLESQQHPFFQQLLKARKLDRGGAVFIQSKILDMQHNGRVHPTFRQVRSDDGGTRSGRFASSNPNMQQVPARDPYISPLIRSIFVPEDGCQWGAFDYSQQEPRVTVHYAYLRGFKGAEDARNKYIENPDTDYHQLVADMANISRKVAKPLNLGLAYGMGKRKMANQLGMTEEEIDPIYRNYHASVPFIKAMGDDTMRVVSNRGYVRTILGRRRRFNLFGPPKWSAGVKPLPYEQALKEFGAPVKRYFIHKAMNALIQGTSADMNKLAMIGCYDEGMIPHIPIHDELDFSIESLSQARRIKEIMVNCVKLEVPLKVDVEIGPSWGEAKEVQL